VVNSHSASVGNRLPAQLADHVGNGWIGQAPTEKFWGMTFKFQRVLFASQE
jgi:hypothetical protein